MPAPASPQPPSRGWFDFLCAGLLCYYLTGLIVVLGVLVSHQYLKPAPHPAGPPGDLLDAFARWDGRWYVQILQHGYTYDPHRHSSIAFFPAFPLLGRAVSALTGLRPELALLLVAHVCLAAAFVVLAAYVHRRYGETSSGGSRPRLAASCVLLAFGLLPTTCFFRMAYSESLFLLAALLALYGMERDWPLLVVAALIGLTTATRPVGVALLPPLLLHLRRRCPGWLGASWRFVALLPLACWGLLAFMAYQHYAFDDPLAFARTQEHWRMRPPVAWPERLHALATLEPLWSVFDPSSPCYWRRHEPQGNPLFSLHLANPLYFVLAVVLVALGAWQRWLNAREVALAVGLLLIPYLTRSHDMCLAGMGRFAAVVVPVYLVLGQLLARLPPAGVGLAAGLSGFLLGAYSALFAAWYRFF
ncbi:MAG: hypothetical protein L0Z62_51190 [Gemmataceae bacterium]|nr:hypothetical protein [Gemmataceae bacterium]